MTVTSIPQSCRDDASWDAQFVRLKAYKAAHGDCSVPARWAADPQLGAWVGVQRTYRRKLERGERQPRTTAERVRRPGP